MSRALEDRLNNVVALRTHAIVVLACGDGEVARWPFIGSAKPNLGTLDTLARRQLWARRLGCGLYLLNPSAELLDLIEVAGLGGVLEVVREPEGFEQPSVQEEMKLGDPLP